MFVKAKIKLLSNEFSFVVSHCCDRLNWLSFYLMHFNIDDILP
jgi:hypothetical protein